MWSKAVNAKIDWERYTAAFYGLGGEGFAGLFDTEDNDVECVLSYSAGATKFYHVRQGSVELPTLVPEYILAFS